MKIGLISDVHCRHGNKLPEPHPDCHVMVLAGDIGNPLEGCLK